MNATLQKLIEEQKEHSFTDPTTVSDEDALGILIAHHFEWDGLAILKAAESALEDANFHAESRIVGELRAKEESE